MQRTAHVHRASRLAFRLATRLASRVALPSVGLALVAVRPIAVASLAIALVSKKNALLSTSPGASTIG